MAMRKRYYSTTEEHFMYNFNLRIIQRFCCSQNSKYEHHTCVEKIVLFKEPLWIWEEGHNPDFFYANYCRDSLIPILIRGNNCLTWLAPSECYSKWFRIIQPINNICAKKYQNYLGNCYLFSPTHSKNLA